VTEKRRKLIWPSRQFNHSLPESLLTEAIQQLAMKRGESLSPCNLLPPLNISRQRFSFIVGRVECGLACLHCFINALFCIADEALRFALYVFARRFQLIDAIGNFSGNILAEFLT